MTKRIWRPLIAAALILLASSLSPAYGQEAETAGLNLIQGDSPSGAMVFLQPVTDERMQPPSGWMLRTGIKKGIRELSLEEEIAAAPDIAILKTGFYEQWAAVLTGMKEPFTLAKPDSIAGLSRTKPVLIVPSGGLAGTTGSEFFKAGLAEYVRSGGTLVCFAQRNGADYSSLPVPAGSRLEAAGWAQDFGPMFGASFIRNRHPLLSRMTRAAPRLETSGYVTSTPEGAQVVLARSDGFPTLVVYHFGSGRVVVAALFPEVLSGQGHLDPEEKALVQDLLFWAKAPGEITPAAVGARMALALTVPGAERQEVASVKLYVIGSGADVPAGELEASIPSKAKLPVSLPFTYTITDRFRPGIYHIEYVLLGQRAQPLSPRAEAIGGWFSVGHSSDFTPPPVSPKPLGAIPGQFRISPSLRPAGTKVQAGIEVTTAGVVPSPLMNDEMIVRLGGREKPVKLEQGKGNASFDLPAQEAAHPIPVALYHANGRLLLRDTLPVSISTPMKPGIILDRFSYLPGESAHVRVSGLGSGELTLSGLGQIDSQIITENGSAALAIPGDLPAGSYPLEWAFRTKSGAVSTGVASVNIAGGYTVAFQNISPAMAAQKDASTVTVVSGVRSTRALAARLKLVLRGPDGTTAPAVEQAITLRPGSQEIPVSFTLKPEQSGIWELSSVISASLPDGPGYPAGPATIAAGKTLLDVGSAAVLGIATDKPVYYEPSGSAGITTYLFGRGKADLRVTMDGNKVAKERLDLSGLHVLTVSPENMKPGGHVLEAKVTVDDQESRRELSFTNGTGLADLAVNLITSDPDTAEMQVGVGVRNLGKIASGKSKAALYDGDPAHGGKLIDTVEVPPLEPGQLNISIVRWPLFKKTGGRTLFAIADTGGAFTEITKKNNAASADIQIPDFLVSIHAERKKVSMDEPLAFTLVAANLTASKRSSLVMDIRLTDRAGTVLASEAVPIPAFSSASEKTLKRAFPPPAASLPVGAYVLSAELREQDRTLASGGVEIKVLPKLSLAGSLAGTPSSAVLCRPMSVQYGVKSTGNVPVSTGSLTIEIRAPGADHAVYSKKLPFAPDARQHTIDNLEIPAGRYGIILKATAVNQEHGIKQEFILAEQPLTVSGPVAAEPASTLFPRALIWMGSPGGSTARAVAEGMIRQAFERGSVYYKVVNSPDDFASEAANGVFNTFVLLDVSDPLEAPQWLTDITGLGQGMVIIGADDTAKAAAGMFGFTFGEPLAGAGAVLAMADKASLGLSGTVPASGTVLQAKKKGATPLAFTADTGQPAAFLDAGGKGKVVLLPFSLVRSAHDSGSSDIYSLVLRAVVHAAAPVREEPGGLSAGSFVLSAPGGPVKAKVAVSLPRKSLLIWTNREGADRENIITYEMMLDAEPQPLLYLYQPPEGGQDQPAAEVFYECEGRYVSQGKIE